MRAKQIWKIRHLNRNGEEIWKDIGENDLADEGEKAMLDVFYRNAIAPTEFYVRLFNDTPLENDTLADLVGEPAGNGYAPQLIERSSVGFPTIQQDANGDWQIVSKTVTFSASGGSWGPVTYAVLATTSDNTGILVAFKALSQSRTLNDGETLEVSLTITQQ